MKTCRRRQLLTVILVCSFSCAPLAEEAPDPAMAMLDVSGMVQVNGSAIPRGTALFSGDRIVYKSYRRQEEMLYERPAGERKVSMKSGAYSAPP